MLDTTTAPDSSFGPLQNGAARAPARNRYFYGKLLDVRHLELEQRYFLDMGRLVNRLTLGAGVVCGLRVSRSNGALVVTPGVAIDGLGREIIVTEKVEIDPQTLVAGQLPEEFWLCLNYHECEVEPAPALVADCDVRETCVPGVIRERYMLTVETTPPPIDPLQETACNGLFGTRLVAAPIVGATDQPPPSDITDALQAIDISADPISILRQRLTTFLQPTCAAGQAYVPLARVTRDTQGGLNVNDIVPRTMIYNNAVLLDLILCLAEHIEECCMRKVTLTAPKITATTPEPGQTLGPGDLETLGGDFVVAFDRALNADRLAAPSDWLRAVVIAVVGGGGISGGGGSGFSFFAPVEFVSSNSPGSGSGVEAVMRFVPVAPGSGSPTTPPTAAQTGHASQSLYQWAQDTLAASSGTAVELTVILLIRSDDITQIVDTSEPPELLDPDYAGTALTSGVVDLLWLSLDRLSGGTYQSFSGNAALRASIAPPGFQPPSLPSGNGIEGGMFHSWFVVQIS